MDVLNTLVDWKKIPAVSETLVRSWGFGLSGLNESQIRKGIRLARDHSGFFDLGAFRKLCFTNEVSHKPFVNDTARLDKPKTLGNARFRELYKVTQAMNEEEPNGPIYQATIGGHLFDNFVKGKKADDIIAWCHNKFGKANE
jgi:hypothetical protein|tara:strand:- start:37 stop:462 length:426 start_codon:yes stop_codon:yes gene_type:complete